MNQTEINPLADDLDHILARTKDLWANLDGKSLFITGGTGFFGSWILESLVWAIEKLEIDVNALVLTRNPDAFKINAPHLAAHRSIDFHIGDIRDFAFPDGNFSHIIHAATTSAVATFNNEDPLTKFDTVAEGTRRALDFAVKCGAENFLLTSSGSACGKQPSSLTHIPEEFTGAPDITDPHSAALGEGKRVAEFLSVLYSKKHGFDVKIARCFTFVGPYLPLDIHYAIGNFIQDAINGGPIKVNGDGTPHRSYLYAADLIIWLWTIFLRGDSCRIYNIGSGESISISDLAKTVAGVFGKERGKPIEVIIAKEAEASRINAPDRYVPSVDRVLHELGLEQTIGLQDAIKRTIAWNTHIAQA
jgi:dTDP-glucose 4,6-dehydratase